MCKQELTKDCKREETDDKEDWFRCDGVSEPVSMNPYEKSKTQHIGMVIMLCRNPDWGDIWNAADIFILITGVVANVALLWIFLRQRTTLSASQVLGVNLVVMDLIYLSIIPVRMIYDTFEGDQKVNESAIFQQDSNAAHPVDEAIQIFSMLNLIGCPLLLACMCIERYLAVIRPVLYLRGRKLEYRVAVSTVVWCVTLSFCLASGFVEDITDIMLCISIIISCLFLLMLACLGGMVWSLWQQSPAHSTYGNQAHSSPLKRQAMVNVVVVVVPAVISYLPVLVMVPMLSYIYYLDGLIVMGHNMCNVLELSILFPKFGVLIGPLFYLSKARQMCCLSGT